MSVPLQVNNLLVQSYAAYLSSAGIQLQGVSQVGNLSSLFPLHVDRNP